MLDFLLLLLVLAGVIALVAALRRAVRTEQQARDRQMMDRVYYPTRGRKADVPPLRRQRRAAPTPQPKEAPWQPPSWSK